MFQAWTRCAGPVAMLAALTMVASGCATNAPEAPSSPSDLRISGHPVIELAPLHYAIAHFGAARPGIPNGAIPALFRGGPGGEADVAGHAETQALKHSLNHPDVRIILTATEGHYYIVAKKSAGIRALADLRGKRIATPRESSAHYYLHLALQTAGMTESDVVIIGLPLPPSGVADILADGKADAVALWDPEPQLAITRLGDDAIILDPDTGYRELYNLNTTAAKLADPVMRAKIVNFVAKVIEASAKMNKDTPGLIDMVAAGAGYPAEPIRASWAHHAFPAKLAPDLLDTMVAEEAWLARHANRKARTREELAVLIDPSVEAEARALLPKRK